MLRRSIPVVLLIASLALPACYQSYAYLGATRPAPCAPCAEVLPACKAEPAPRVQQVSGDRYAAIKDNAFVSPLAEPLSTFSVDVDTASYANVRRFLNEGQLPPADAVRIEEMINYFSYGYAPPATLKADEAIGERAPFAVHTEVCACPWKEGHKLVRIGIKGMAVDMGHRPPAHLVFLVDVSGSMFTADRLPLAKAALIRLLSQLNPDDKVSLVTYAGETGCALEAASCADKNAILGAIDGLGAGGSTNGAGGITRAYAVAQKHFVKGGINRVILCTDGDFNVGVSDTASLLELVKEKANPEDGRGVFLSTCGFGRGNLNDAMMEKIADAGNGNYAYMDSLAEAEKVFVKQAGGTLVTIAKDVKLQVEFNPAKVGQYRLIGYEDRVLQDKDFNDDKVDAGDIGAGHTVTALYEIAPPSERPAKVDPAEPVRSVDPLVYQTKQVARDAGESADLLTLKLRHKPAASPAKQGTSRLQTFTVKDEAKAFDDAGDDTRLAAAVAAYGMLLRHSPHAGEASYRWVEKTAAAIADRPASAPDAAECNAQRREFLELVKKARKLD